MLTAQHSLVPHFGKRTLAGAITANQLRWPTSLIWFVIADVQVREEDFHTSTRLIPTQPEELLPLVGTVVLPQKKKKAGVLFSVIRCAGRQERVSRQLTSSGCFTTITHTPRQRRRDTLRVTIPFAIRTPAMVEQALDSS